MYYIFNCDMLYITIICIIYLIVFYFLGLNIFLIEEKILQVSNSRVDSSKKLDLVGTMEGQT